MHAVAENRRNKAPLMPLLVIEEPFKRNAMDIVGPVQESSQGNRFILTVMNSLRLSP
jgi:hypothetical protein